MDHEVGLRVIDRPWKVAGLSESCTRRDRAEPNTECSATFLPLALFNSSCPFTLLLFLNRQEDRWYLSSLNSLVEVSDILVHDRCQFF